MIMKVETRGRKPLNDAKATTAIWHRLDFNTWSKWMLKSLKERRSILNKAIDESIKD